MQVSQASVHNSEAYLLFYRLRPLPVPAVLSPAALVDASDPESVLPVSSLLFELDQEDHAPVAKIDGFSVGVVARERPSCSESPVTTSDGVLQTRAVSDMLAASAVAPVVSHYFFPCGTRLYDEGVFQRIMLMPLTRENLQQYSWRTVYSESLIGLKAIQTLRDHSFIDGALLCHLVEALQAEHEILRAEHQPSPGPVISSSGAVRLGRVLLFSPHQPPPLDRERKLHGTPIWSPYHFVLLKLLDVIAFVIHIGGIHYSVIAVDLCGRCLRYYDSISNFRLDLAKLYCHAVLQWVGTLAQLLGANEYSDATSWPVHFHNSGHDMPRQGSVVLGDFGSKWDWGVDCACFAGSAVACISRGIPFNFTQRHMASLRRQLAYLVINWRNEKGGSSLTLCQPQAGLTWFHSVTVSMQVTHGCLPEFWQGVTDAIKINFDSCKSFFVEVEKVLFKIMTLSP
jgi:hypothetical protein